ncbi:MAG TPA: type II CAAX endopeptidase family protein [Dokdonella sp.]|jgi:membrane protease YdiL (CAAX protease family)|nr:CPBP family intramembrane metalloprotease [Rhodanobacteraceae bacterium]HQX33830.1 type II CAAX endopeptidase family protein [Dokdonella sp.]
MTTIFRDREGKLRNGWWILVFYLTLAVLLIPAVVCTSRNGAQLGIPEQALLVVIATGICLFARRDRPRNVWGSLASWRRDPITGLVLGMVIWGATAFALWIAGTVTWRWSGMGAAAFSTALLDCAAVAIVEELLFRGFPFQRLVDGIGAWPAQLAMAGYFTLTHSSGIASAGDLQWLAGANIYLASLLFGACYIRTKSLALPITLHFTLNFAQGPLLGFGVSGQATDGLFMANMGHAASWWNGGAFGLEASLPGTFAILVALAIILHPRMKLCSTRLATIRE